MGVNFPPTNYRSLNYPKSPAARTTEPNSQTRGLNQEGSETTSPDNGIIQYNQLRLNLATLSTKSVSELMDHLEWTEDKSVSPDNGVMGTNAIVVLANLDVNDERWKVFENRGIFFPSQLRPKIKKAAQQVLQVWDLLVYYLTGEDQIFSSSGILNWLYKNPVTLAMIGKGQDYYEFQNAMKILNMKSNLKMMDYLEWYHDHSKALPSNGRFGTMGIWLLSNLSVDSPLWKKGGIYMNHRKLEAINAAKIALKPTNAMLLLQTHDGDEIYEKGEIQKWLAKNP